jgi:CubicO group peptidase (beta-lactamase class C family)
MTSAALGDLDPLINEAMEEWQVPGLALAVVLDGEPALLKAYGQRDVEAGLPVTVDTQFILCSITKSFTAAGLGTRSTKSLYYLTRDEILPDERRNTT